MSRAREMRANRRQAQFAKFRLTQLNLVPLVDTFVSIVFFALTTAVVGEMSPVVPGVNLPSAQVGDPAHQQLTIGVGRQVTLSNRPVMTTVDAARTPSNNPSQPLLIPQLYAVLRTDADSIRRVRGIGGDSSVDVKLAIQADSTMRYDLLSRIMQTARLAGFRNLSLQIQREQKAAPSGT